jgi:hypothetical protein
MSEDFMQNFWPFIGWILLAVFVFFPWVLGFVDCLSVFLTGFCVTNIPWNSWRVMMAFLWPMFWSMMAASFCF